MAASTQRESGQKKRWLTRIFTLLLAGGLCGSFLSDSGVQADDAIGILRLPGSTPVRLARARVVETNAQGWLTVVRPSESRLAGMTLVTGLGCRQDPQACQQLKQGRFDQAAEEYRAQVRSGHDEVDLRCGLANALFLEGDLMGAVRTFTWAAAGDGTDPNVHNGLGNALAELKLVAQARDEFRALSTIPGYAAVAHNNLGNALRHTDRLEEALSEYEKAVLADPVLVAPYFNRGLALLELDRPALAAEAFGEAVQRLPGLAEGYFYEGLALLRGRYPARAAVALMRADELGLENPALSVALGIACQENGLDLEAARHFDRARHSGLRDPRVHHLMAFSLMRSGLAEQAAEVLKEGFELGPQDAEAHFSLGLKLIVTAQYEDAAGHFLVAIGKGRRDADAFFGLGQALLLAGQVDAAVQALKVATNLKPDRVEVHIALGQALQQNDDIPGALREVLTATALGPDDPDALGLLMSLQAASGDHVGCARTGRRLIDTEPERVRERFATALCHGLAGEFDQAAERMEDALDHDLEGDRVVELQRQLERLVESDNPPAGAWLLLAIAHERRGDWAEAREAYEHFVLATPPKDWQRRILAHLRELAPAP